MEIHDENNVNIYCIVPGFLGNYSDGFTKRLCDHLIAHKKNVHCVTFFGHEKKEQKLWNLHEMSDHLTEEVRGLTSDPLSQNKKIVLLAHSQGCAVTLNSITNINNETIDIKLLAPAIYIAEIILPRISDEDKEKIQISKTSTLCKVSQKNYKLINQNWINSYKNFSIIDQLSHINNNCQIIYPIDDFIDKKNIHILEKNLPHAHTDTIDSNHFFDKNENDLSNLANLAHL